MKSLQLLLVLAALSFSATAQAKEMLPSFVNSSSCPTPPPCPVPEPGTWIVGLFGAGIAVSSLVVQRIRRK